MKSIAHTLIEANTESCMDKYGSELFGGYFGNERDTQEESKLFYALREYTSATFGENLENEFIKGLKSFKSCINNYPNAKPHKTIGTIYRGINVTPAEFKLLVGVEHTSLTPDQVVTFDYKPKYVIESWTDDMNTATYFAGNGFKKGKIKIMISTSAKKDVNLFFDTSLMRLIGEYEEPETLRFTKDIIKNAKVLIVEETHMTQSEVTKVEKLLKQ